MPNPWVIGELIQGQYLNSLQELISDWSDNVLLQSSGADVVVPAATSAPAELLIEGQMRYANSDEEVTLSGPPGLYNIYATTKRGRVDFELEASTADVTAQYRRRLGVAEFDGVNVVAVTSDVREINVSYIDGHPPEQVAPRPAAIPAGRVDATLDPDWLPNLDDIRIPVGALREVWLPAGETFVLPMDWRVCDGSSVPSGQHAFRGPGGTIYAGPVPLPNMHNQHVRGGAVSGVVVSGTNVALDMSHTHGLGGGGVHMMQAHLHDIDPHTHDLGFHNADLPDDPPKVNVATLHEDLTHFDRIKDRIYDVLRDASGSDIAVLGPSGSGDTQAGTAVEDAPTISGPVGGGNGEAGGLQTGGPANVTVTPRSLGVLHIMRVK